MIGLILEELDHILKARMLKVKGVVPFLKIANDVTVAINRIWEKERGQHVHI